MTTDWRIWALGSAGFAALTAILAKVGVAGVPSNLATAVRTGVVLAFSWALVAATGEAGRLREFSPRTWLFLGLSGLATGLSWLCYFRALQLGDASRVAPVGERRSWHEWVGGGLILAGAVVIALKPG